MVALPRRQREIVAFIRRYLEAEGTPPSFRDIAAHFKVKVATIQEQLAALEKKGVIQKPRGRSRGIRLVEKEGFSPRSIPILGWTTAGRPELAIENHEGHLAVDGAMLRGEAVFALKIRGQSMIEAGILDGDHAFVRVQPSVENGEIALVIVDGEEATIKAVFKRGNTVELRPANSQMEPLLLPAGRVRIQGKVIGIFRTMG